MTAQRRRRGRVGGNYYAYTSIPKPDRPGCYATREVGYQLRTFKRAKAALDATGLRGYVEYWSESQQRRIEAARRDADGAWTVRDPYTGEYGPLYPQGDQP